MHGAVPPPIPIVMYHVAINGKAIGPVDSHVLKEIYLNGSVTNDTLVWKSRMENWIVVSAIDELKQVF